MVATRCDKYGNLWRDERATEPPCTLDRAMGTLIDLEPFLAGCYTLRRSAAPTVSTV